jgi:hypothetical protein
MNLHRKKPKMARAAARSAWNDLIGRRARPWLRLGAILRWHGAVSGRSAVRGCRK